jgi:hypothetical protein
MRGAGLALLFLATGADALGDLMMCEDDADCQYQACVQVDGVPTTAVCRPPDGMYSAERVSKLCYQYRADTMNPSLPPYLYECASGPCVAGKYKEPFQYLPYGPIIIVDYCRPCPVGFHAPVASEDTVCIRCGPGTYQNTMGSTACSVCSPGSYQPRTTVTRCLPCAAGTYQSMPGQSSGCLNCTAGTYQPLTGQEACTACERGSYSTVQGGVSRADCSACPQGTFSLGLGSCSACSTRPPDRYYMHGECNATHDTEARPCTTSCAAGQVVVANCTRNSDTQCGSRACAASTRGLFDAGLWLPSLRCGQAQYLYGFDSNGTADCRRCPASMIGRDGFRCEPCAGPLEEPYWLDQGSCVCKVPARMDASGVCVCPDGWSQRDGAGQCEPCAEYGLGGACYECGAGNYSYLLGGGATACERCAEGKYRLQAQKQGCQSCAPGWYAPDPALDACVPCNRSCKEIKGWRDAGACPGNAEYRVCAPCDWALPEHAAWRAGCIYECDAGYYKSTGHRCSACSTGACPAGRLRGECTADADTTCDAECVNTSKPLLYSKWVEGEGCPWACEAGYALQRSDYWVFEINECVPNR